MSTQLDRIAAKAKADRKVRVTSLAHVLTPAFLTDTWRQMNRRGASGIDGETTQQFERELETRVQDICARLRAGTSRAPPVRRVAIPKGPGKVGTRPLGIPTVEDRLVQRAVARILEAVFEGDFLDCSYGFRPGRSPHQALRALRGTIVAKKVRHLFEADIRGCFGAPGEARRFQRVQFPPRQGLSQPTGNRVLGAWRQRHGLSVDRATRGL